MLKLHVILAVDRAGLVGEDGETHHGIFDIGFLRQAPGMTILCPGSRAELQDMLFWAAEEQNGPVAIRYPRGGDRAVTASAWVNSPAILTDGALTCHRTGKDAAIITYGTLLQNAMDAADILAMQGIETTVLRLQTLSPLPVQKVLEHIKGTPHVVVLEETGKYSGICQDLAYELCLHRIDLRIDSIDLGSNFVTHGAIEQLYHNYGLDAESVARFIQEVHQNEK